MTEIETETPVPELTPAEVAANRATWVAALRSGDYEQASETLRTQDGYCCLGVAEDVRGATWVDDNAEHAAEPNHVISWAVQTDGDDDGDVVGREFTALTVETRRWLGLHQADPTVAYRHPGEDHYETTGLISLNDDTRLTLAEIGDVVADQPPDWDGTMLSATRDVERRNRQEVTL